MDPGKPKDRRGGIMLARLQEVRERYPLTLRELEERSGIDEASISKIERLKHGVRPRTARRLAAALGVPVAALMEPWEGEVPREYPLGLDLREELDGAEAEGGLEARVAVLRRYVEGDPERFARWVYEVHMSELEARRGLREGDYPAALRDALRAGGKTTEFWSVVAALALERLRDAAARGDGAGGDVEGTGARLGER